LGDEYGGVAFLPARGTNERQAAITEATTVDFLDLDDLDSVTDVCFGFVTDPSPRRSQRLAIVELQDMAPHVIDVLESMVLDGIEEREEVAQYVQFVFGS
jgi:hypothetical protein